MSLMIDRSTPAGSEDRSLGDDRIRELKTALQDIFGIPDATTMTIPYMQGGVNGLTRLFMLPSGLDPTVDGELTNKDRRLLFNRAGIVQPLMKTAVVNGEPVDVYWAAGHGIGSIMRWLVPGNTAVGAAIGPQGDFGVYSGATATVTPIGNPTPTLTALHAEANTLAPATREFLAYFGLNAVHGAGQSTPASDKVALYAGCRALSGSSAVWAANFLTEMTAPATFGHIVEFDLNNETGVNYGDADGVAGFVAPALVGISVSGGGPQRATVAILVSGPGPGQQIWNKGIAFANDCVRQVCFIDVGNSVKSIDIQGNHAWGIDLNFMSSGVPIRFKHDHFIVWRNQQDTVDMQILGVDGSPSNNVYLIANTSVGALFIGAGGTGTLWINGQWLDPLVSGMKQITLGPPGSGGTGSTRALIIS